jgi:hypothetical protein
VGPDAEAIAEAVRALPSVAALGGGTVTQAATFLPGRHVAGVRIGPASVEVHVTARYGVPLPDLAAAVRAAAVLHSAGLPVDVAIDDLEVPGLDEPSGPVAELTESTEPAPGLGVIVR